MLHAETLGWCAPDLQGASRFEIRTTQHAIRSYYRSKPNVKIGFRIPGRAREISFEELCNWAVKTGFGSIDLGSADPERIATARKAGLEIGTIDLPGTAGLVNPAPGKQAQGTEAATAAIGAARDNGGSRRFTAL